MSEDFISSLRAREVEGAITKPVLDRKCPSQGGAFEGLVATIIEMDEKQRPLMLLDLLNQSVRVRTDVKGVRVVRELQSFSGNVHAHDPIADSGECKHEYGIPLTLWDKLPKACTIIAAVAHADYKAMGLETILSKLQPGGIVADVKCAYDPAAITASGARLWRL